MRTMEQMPSLSGADPIYIPLVPPEYDFDPDLIEDGFRQGAKAIIICNPSNPCGKVFTKDELEPPEREIRHSTRLGIEQ